MPSKYKPPRIYAPQKVLTKLYKPRAYIRDFTVLQIRDFTDILEFYPGVYLYNHFVAMYHQILPNKA